MVGAFGVGKTSLVRRYVHQQFDERYQTTLGVKIDTSMVETDNGPIKFVLWDTEGADPVGGDDRSMARIKSYLRGAHGIILVADGTRPETLETALDIYQTFCREHSYVPAVVMANKADLTDEWRFDLAQVPESLVEFQCSALDGRNVEAAFSSLGDALSA